jgi:copper chaperone CopZ
MRGAAARLSEEREKAVPDVMVWVTKPGDEDVPDLETLGEEVRRLDHVSEVDVRTEGSVVHVSFEGGRAEQEEIEGTIRETGYEIFKVSHSRSPFQVPTPSECHEPT